MLIGSRKFLAFGVAVLAVLALQMPDTQAATVAKTEAKAEKASAKSSGKVQKNKKKAKTAKLPGAQGAIAAPAVAK